MLAEELRRVVDDLGGVPEPASRLRVELDRRLGPAEVATHRRELRLAVAALEEQVPVQLRSGGAGDENRRRAAHQLATVRGWTVEAAIFAVDCWAYALRLGDVVPTYGLPAATNAVDEGAVEAPLSPPTIGGPVVMSVPELFAPPPPTMLPATALHADAFAGTPPTLLPGAGAPAAEPGVVPPAVASEVRTEVDLPVPAVPRPFPKSQRSVLQLGQLFLGHQPQAAYSAIGGVHPALVVVALPAALAGYLAPLPAAPRAVLGIGGAVMLVVFRLFGRRRVLVVDDGTVVLCRPKHDRLVGVTAQRRPLEVVVSTQPLPVTMVRALPIATVSVDGKRVHVSPRGARARTSGG